MYILPNDAAVLCSFHNKSKLDWDCLQSFVTKADQNMVQLNCKNGSDMSFVGQEPAQNGQAGCKALEE